MKHSLLHNFPTESPGPPNNMENPFQTEVFHKTNKRGKPKLQSDHNFRHQLNYQVNIANFYVYICKVY